MRVARVSALLCLCLCCLILPVYSQSKPAEVPRVIRYSGTLRNVDGSPRIGTVGVTFSIYAEQSSTAPLWQEVQNVMIDAEGHYTVLVGMSRSEGLPEELFSGNVARWLGIRVNDEPEQPRAILAAVPYALKAADAETLGGKPLSAFVLNDAATGAGSGSGAANGASGSVGKTGLQPLSINTAGSGGTQNTIAKWTDAGGTVLGNSLLTDSGSAVGLNNNTPTTAFDVSGTIRAVLGPGSPFGTYLMPTGGAANSFRFGFGNNLYFDGTNWRTKGDSVNNAGSGLLTDIATGQMAIFTLPSTGGSDQVYSDSTFNGFERMRITQDGKVGIGLASPATKLDVAGTIHTFPFGSSMMPNGGAANSFRFGFGNNLYFDGTNWRTTGDSVNNAGSAIVTSIDQGHLQIFTLPSTGGTDQVVPNAGFNAFEKMRITSSGNVGIGTTTPAQKLDVNGNIAASGNIAATGTISGSNLNATGTTTLTGTPSGSGVGQGALYVNPAAATAGQTLLGVAVGGSQKMLVDGSGNLSAAGTLSGTSLVMPATTAPTSGVVILGGTPFLHGKGSYNTFLGPSAGSFDVMTGIGNTGVGWNALSQNTASNYNTAVGANALQFTTAESNSAFGAFALWSNINGGENTALGAWTLSLNPSGGDNTAVGYGALRSNHGSSNTAIGVSALTQNTSGWQNTAVGVSALQANTSGENNTAIGNFALSSAATAYSNTAVGYYSLQKSTAHANTALGTMTLALSTTGTENVAIGISSLAQNTTGSGNIAIGSSSGYNSTTGSNNIYVGNTGVTAENGTIRLGASGTHTQTYIAGAIHGDGSGLTNLSVASLPSNVALKDAANTFSAPQTISAGNTTLTAGGGSVGVSGSGISYGVFGSSIDGAGIYGYAPHGDGVYGASTYSNGVEGRGSTVGVLGRSDVGTSGPGISGIGVMGYGVWGYGVYGISDHNYAGYFEGDVNVTGSLSKAGGSFKIDHPLDPANKYLSHSFVESPDMKDVYDGVVVLDDAGQAWVQLPEWFEALNRDFRYQLTAIGAPGPNLYIAQEVSANKFQIAGGKPGARISWQVTGIRRDSWANDHRIPVEEEKPVDQRGRYLYPQGFGHNAESAIGRVPVKP